MKFETEILQKIKENCVVFSALTLGEVRKSFLLHSNEVQAFVQKQSHYPCLLAEATLTFFGLRGTGRSWCLPPTHNPRHVAQSTPRADLHSPQLVVTSSKLFCVPAPPWIPPPGTLFYRFISESVFAR